MYTAKILRKTADRQLKKLYIDFEYLNDGVQVATETREFPLDVTLTEITRHALNATKRLEVLDATLDTIPVGTDLDLASVGEVAPTAAEIAKQEWFRDFGRLEQVQRLVTLGAFPTAMQADLDALKAKVQTNFKKAYIADM